MAANMYLRLLLGLLLPALAAGLAVMSVDYGGEFLKVAIVKPGVPMEIVLNKESQRKTPNIVALRDGERIFGDAALSSAMRYPKSAYRYLHDVLGKDFDNPLVTEFRRKYPYYEMEKDPDTGSVLFVHDENTKYSPEELVAMILQKAKESAEAFAEQPISEIVITVPAFFNQAERRAMIRAAELVGLKVLQLIGDNAAVALNYGVFRRKSFNATPSYYMFFDIGATATVTTIVEYQVVKTKTSSGLSDTFPQLTIKGVGFNRTLGGSEFQRRLRDHLARTFNTNRKVKKDVFEDNKALQKLYKEAGRVKQVLSANADHFAQVENLADDEDFRAKVTREEFESLCADLFEGIGKTVQDALDVSQLTMTEINEVILMGGGTRVPKIQETLKAAIGREELGKGINTDEAAALGAVYQAAHLGKGFKVQKFNVKEAVVYPIQVEFDRVRTPGESEDASKTVTKTLFGRLQPYPHKKVMTFNKNTKDFAFQINYGDLKFLTEEELKYLGHLSLSTVELSGIEEAFSKHGEADAPKGIKAHFNIDESGILHVDKVEATFEKIAPVESEEEESTLTKLGKSFSSFFGSKTAEDEAGKEGSVESEEAVKKNGTEEQSEDKTEEPVKEEKEDREKTPENETENQDETEQMPQQEEQTGKQEETAQSDESKEGETAGEKADDEKTREENATEKQEKEGDAGKTEEVKLEKPKEEKKSQILLVKEPLKVNVKVQDLENPDQEKLKLAKKHLNDLKKRDEEKDLLEKAKNDIESFVFDTRDKLEQKVYIKCSTQEERKKIGEALDLASDWMFEQDDNAPRKVYTEKLDELRLLTRDLFERVFELEQRPYFVETLSSRVNHSEYFLAGMANFTGEDQPFTKVEFDTLKTLIKDTKAWNKTVHDEQKKTPLTEKPRFTVEDLMTKINALDREIKYLVNKVKSYKPKTKPKENATETAEKASEGETGDESPLKAEEGGQVPPPPEEPKLEIPIKEEKDKSKETHDNGEL